MKTEYFRISVSDKGDGWVEISSYSLDSSKFGLSVWRILDIGLECEVAHGQGIVKFLGSAKAQIYVEKALARKEQYSIAEIEIAE